MSKSKRIAFSIILTIAIFVTIFLLIRYASMPDIFLAILFGLPAILIESTPLVAAYIILGFVFVALFSIFFIIFYLLFGIKKDYSAEISEITRLIENTKQEVKNEYLGNIDIISPEQLNDSLTQRKKLLLDELKLKYGKTNKKSLNFIESSVESSWKELETLFRSKKAASNKTDSFENEEYLDELSGEDDEDNLEVLDVADENDENKIVAYSIPDDSVENQTENQKIDDSKEIDDVEELEEPDDFEELEELEEPEFINPLEVIGELEEIDDFDESTDKSNFNVVEQLEEADENLEELEELVEYESEPVDNEELEELVEEELLEGETDSIDGDELEELVENGPEEQKEFEGLEEDELEELSELCDDADDIEEIEDADDVEEIEELEEIDYKDPYPELLVNLQDKPVYSADSNLTFISSLNDNFANVENIFAEDLSIGTEYIHELRLMNSDFTFVPVKLEFVLDEKSLENKELDDKSIDEPLPVDSESCFSLTRFNENQQDAVELEEDSVSTIIEVGGVFSIAEGLSYEGVQQDQSFKALVNSVIGTGK
jgi:hypothetical protein